MNQTTIRTPDLNAQIVARRKTADGTRVDFWSNGDVTYTAFGLFLKGKGTGTPTTAKGREVAIAANRLIDPILYTRAELATLVRVARRLVSRNPNATPGDLRAAVSEVLR